MRVHDSQTYRKMDVTRECISHILELRKTLLSFQTGFNLVNLVFANTQLKEGVYYNNKKGTSPIFHCNKKRGTLSIFYCNNQLITLPTFYCNNKRGTLQVLGHQGVCWCPGCGSVPAPGNRSDQVNKVSSPTLSQSMPSGYPI